MAAGDLRYRLGFQKQSMTEDEFGNPVPGDFETQFTAAVYLKPLKGGEEVMAGRLAGTQTFVCRIRSYVASREITTAWRAIDARAGNDESGDPKIVYQVKSPPSDPDGKLAWLEMIVEFGTAA
jgi:head-tail adaptor